MKNLVVVKYESYLNFHIKGKFWKSVKNLICRKISLIFRNRIKNCSFCKYTVKILNKNFYWFIVFKIYICVNDVFRIWIYEIKLWYWILWKKCNKIGFFSGTIKLVSIHHLLRLFKIICKLLYPFRTFLKYNE